MEIKCGSNSAYNLLKTRVMPIIITDAVLRPLLRDNHDGSIYVVPTIFEHIYQKLWSVVTEKPIESSASIHSVAQTLTKEKEKDKRMKRGGEKTKTVTERVNKGKKKMERGKGDRIA